MATVAEVCSDEIAFTYEAIDRLILNVYLPRLQTAAGVASFFREAWRCPIPSPVLFKRWTDRFVAGVQVFAEASGVAMVRAEGRQKPGEVAAPWLAAATREEREGVVVIVVHQERGYCFTGRHVKGERKSAFEVVREMRVVNHYYFYVRDREYGEGFIRICSYAPFPMRVWLNGHGWLESELRRRGIGYRMFENSFVEVEDAERLRALAEKFGEKEVLRFVRRWLRRLPLPLTRAESARGYGWGVSIYQMELSQNAIFKDTRVLNRVFEGLVRDHLHFGRPDMLKVFYDRRIQRNTPGRFATRVLRQGVVACLKTFYKKSFLKQYNKGGCLLRTELCINDPRDFGVRKSLTSLGYLRRIAHNATTRFLQAQAVCQHTALDRSVFERIVAPSSDRGGQRVAALKLGAPRAMKLLEALCHVGLLFCAFRNRDLRQHVVELLGCEPEEYRASQMSYDLRKLRGKGLVRKLEGRSRYVLTPIGYRAALLITKLYERALTPVCQPLGRSRSAWEHSANPVDRALVKLDRGIEDLLAAARIAA